jgi:hypothetical protein
MVSARSADLRRGAPNFVALPPGQRMLTLARSFWRAVSSAVEHCFHTAGVTGSSPVPPTIKFRRFQCLMQILPSAASCSSACTAVRPQSSRTDGSLRGPAPNGTGQLDAPRLRMAPRKNGPVPRVHALPCRSKAANLFARCTPSAFLKSE